MSENGVVVGVTGRDEDTAALRFAREHAALIGAEVTLVHAVHSKLPPPPPSPLQTSGPTTLESGRQIVRAAVEQYEAMAGEKPRTVVEEGVPAVVLTRLSESADLVVLGHRQLSTVRRLLTRSTTFAVAAHASCPVVAVPAGFSSTAGSQDVVTLGAHEKGIPDRVLRTALAVASKRGARLRVVHAWRREGEYDDLIAGRTSDDWTSAVEEALRKSAQRFADEYPGVSIEVVVQHAWPAEALVEASRSSALLVLGRHQSDPPLPQRLGSLARVVLDHAEGPVMVVPAT
jgi:nucleotide-binding universal stress UspA family protein